jgi:ubiquinone biosynthesis protein UbiJ
MGTAPFVRPFEALVNRNIAASTPARALLKTLSGRAFAIELETPVGGRLLRLRLRAGDEAVSIDTGEEPADASVTGTPLGLAALLAGRAGGRFTAAGVAIRGDAEVAAAFEKLLKHARPELEEELARLVGDVPAHYAARAARGLAEWGRRAVDSLTRNVGEYLTEEGRDLVPRAELDGLLAGIDRIREDADRLEARLALAAARAGRTAP